MFQPAIGGGPAGEVSVKKPNVGQWVLCAKKSWVEVALCCCGSEGYLDCGYLQALQLLQRPVLHPKIHVSETFKYHVTKVASEFPQEQFVVDCFMGSSCCVCIMASCHFRVSILYPTNKASPT